MVTLLNRLIRYPYIRDILENCSNATNKQIENIKSHLSETFPAEITDLFGINVQYEIETLA